MTDEDRRRLALEEAEHAAEAAWQANIKSKHVIVAQPPIGSPT
jgi:hypothetical protein